MHLFQIKLKVLLEPLTGHFTLKMLRNMQEAMCYHFAEISLQARFSNEPGLLMD